VEGESDEKEQDRGAGKEPGAREHARFSRRLRQVAVDRFRDGVGYTHRRDHQYQTYAQCPEFHLARFATPSRHPPLLSSLFIRKSHGVYIVKHKRPFCFLWYSQPMKTKAIATLGMKTGSAEMIRVMIENGMDIARITFSHCPHEEYKFRAECVRKFSKELGREVKILQDLQGPKIRLGNLNPSPSVIEKDKIYSFSTDPSHENLENYIFIKYPGLNEKVKSGDEILVHDGRVKFVVEQVEGAIIKAKALNSGKVWSRNGLNLPHTDLGEPSFTTKDREDLTFALENFPPDYVAVSFVKNSEDLKEVKKLVEGKSIKVVAKIETAQALENIDEIAEAADVIMIARGDLGVEIPLERVPATQKWLIKKAKEHDKPCIVATGLLNSMKSDFSPSRSDVSDIANAVWDGADMLMLSNETTSGDYPVESLQTLIKVATEAEKSKF
jgi:pyruvate kinase